MDKITELCFDGGNKIYHYIQPDWNGADYFFNIQSVGGFEYLKNLRSLVYISMVDEEVVEPMIKRSVLVE